MKISAILASILHGLPLTLKVVVLLSLLGLSMALYGTIIELLGVDSSSVEILEMIQSESF